MKQRNAKKIKRQVELEKILELQQSYDDLQNEVTQVFCHVWDMFNNNHERVTLALDNYNLSQIVSILNDAFRQGRIKPIEKG
jgi:hypothetical protein